jgi:ABC-type dipeptide/oligopeptide/nickel transport system ATPase component
MKTNFIKNYDIIREENREDDYFESDTLIKDVEKTINSIKKPSILGIVGKFGSGKSTILNIIKEKSPEKTWIIFDAWKFPDRNDLWEGFVLEFARQISPKTFKEARKKIDGSSKDSEKKLLEVLARGANLFIPGASIMENFKYFFKSSPAKRVFEIQEILEEIINEQKEDINIIIEDIDRSGDSGIFFLETLNNFICSLKTKNKILTLMPISEESYHKNLESYLKCIGHFYFFKPPNIKLDTFIKAVIDDDFITNDTDIEQIVDFLEFLLRTHNITPRQLNLILREADTTYKKQISDNWSPDFRISLLFTSAKYIYRSSDSKETYFNLWKYRGKRISQDTIFAKFLFVLWPESINKKIILPNQKTVDVSADFILVEQSNVNTKTELPWWPRMSIPEEENFILTSKYLEY